MKPLKTATDAGGGHYSSALLEAVDQALRLDPAERPQNIEQWRETMRPAFPEDKKLFPWLGNLFKGKHESEPKSAPAPADDEHPKTGSRTDTPPAQGQASKESGTVNEPPTVATAGEPAALSSPRQASKPITSGSAPEAVGGPLESLEILPSETVATHGHEAFPERTAGSAKENRRVVRQKEKSQEKPQERSPRPGVGWRYAGKAPPSGTFSSDGVLRGLTPKDAYWRPAVDATPAKMDSGKPAGAFSSHVPRHPPPREDRPFFTGGAIPAREEPAAPEFVSHGDQSQPGHEQPQRRDDNRAWFEGGAAGCPVTGSPRQDFLSQKAPPKKNRRNQRRKKGRRTVGQKGPDRSEG
ncbi:MAG: hypothetical protein BECKG1743F_GA0114225_101673 [Candidatus Kentron sp. G]|nr:MAG: hypothetical protein BECKG1743F_GA0114225_101673 [Candidatus Kentron sp. G]VFM98092.1 MAG: hypothetical protein BECKG1743E_GA0114224_101683 [Candidatus Kentron sp. G]